MSWWSDPANAPTVDPRYVQMVKNGSVMFANCVAGASSAAAVYADKTPCRTSKLSGKDWMEELRTGNEVRTYESFRSYNQSISPFIRFINVKISFCFHYC